MARLRTSLRSAAVGLVVLFGAAGCKALFFDLDSVSLQSADAGADTAIGDTIAPPTDASEVDGETAADTPGDTANRDTDDDTHVPDPDADTTGRTDADTSTPPPPPEPREHCLAVSSCAYLNCPDLEESCVGNATMFGNPGPRQAATEVLNCAKTNGCDYYFGEQCLDDQCSREAKRCLDQKPTVDLTCFEVVQCRRICEKKGTACKPGNCTDGATRQARNRFDKLQRCLRDECSAAIPEPRDECLRTKCAQPFDTCMGCP